MSFPFRFKTHPDTFSHLVEHLRAVVEALHTGGQLEAYRSINGDLLVAMDGTQYFSSEKIHCPQCSERKHRNGTITYSHHVVTPVIVPAPAGH